MDRQKAKELLPIITAFAEGREVEGRICDESDWITITGDKFWPSDVAEYRIKPEPREWLINKQNSQSIRYLVGDIYPYPSTDWVRVREVLE